MAAGKAHPEKATATAIAMMRCVATSLPSPYNYDSRALTHEWHFLPFSTKILVWLVNFCNRYLFLCTPKDTWGGLGFNLCRMQHVDRTLVDALKVQNCKQVVFLGAGADCRATRYADLFRQCAAKAFELDLPGMMAYKKEIVKSKIVSNNPGVTADHISYHPCNFATTPVDVCLLQSTEYRPSVKTLINWEGVTYYLTAAAIDSTMRSLQKVTTKGSILTFDFLLDTVIDKSHPDTTAAQMVEAFQNKESLLWGLDPSQLEAFLSKYDFELLHHETPAILEEKYMMKRSDGKRLFPLKPFFHIAVARRM